MCASCRAIQRSDAINALPSSLLKVWRCRPFGRAGNGSKRFTVPRSHSRDTYTDEVAGSLTGRPGGNDLGASGPIADDAHTVDHGVAGLARGRSGSFLN